MSIATTLRAAGRALRGPDALDSEERMSLTMHGEAVAVQIRSGVAVLHVRDNAPRAHEDGQPVVLTEGDLAKLHELLTQGRLRGMIL